jgi:hypothetical protein
MIRPERQQGNEGVPGRFILSRRVGFFDGVEERKKASSRRATMAVFPFGRALEFAFFGHQLMEVSIRLLTSLSLFLLISHRS